MKIVPINAATLPIYRDELARLLTDAVTHGASVGYDTLIPHEDAESYFHSLRPALAKGELLLWIARDERGVVGTVQLELCQKPNGRNRAEVVKLLVHSLGYRCLGELPDYAAGPDGHYHPTVIYYKRLFAVNQPSRAIAS